ncbi:MAG: ABC transporter permease [Acidimicrobiales bacterium]
MTTVSDAGTTELATSRPLSVDLHKESTSPGEFLRQLWLARHLIVVLTRKEFHTRYRRVSLGVLWALLIPFLQAAVMVLILSHVIKVQKSVHYGAFVLSGIIPWTFFTGAVTSGATAIVDGVGLAARVYFPRAVLPIVQVAQNLYTFLISMVIVIALIPVLGVSLAPSLILIIPATLMLIALALSFSLALSALHVYFRDIRFIVTAAMLLWFYVTPIIYQTSAAPKVTRGFINVNPVTGVLDLFREAIIGNQSHILAPIFISLVWTAGLIVLGFLLQARRDRVFTDRL